jgi:type I restriction enzyme S subunit
LNKVWVAEFDGLCSVDQYVYEVDASVADAEFVAWFIRSPHYLSRAPVQTGPGQLPRIRLEEVAAVEFDLPDLDQQRHVTVAIQARMAEVERTRAGIVDQLTSAELFRASCLRGAFREVSPLSVGPAKDRAPDGWRWVPLSQLARLESGHTPSRRHPEWWDGDIPWIALPDIRALDGKMAFDTAEHINEDGVANSAARVLPAGTVVLSRTASVGFVTVMGRPMTTSQDFVNWVCGPELNPHFLVSLFLRAREFIRSLGSGAVHKTVYVPTVENFHVCVPTKAEQQSIVARLTERMAAVERARKAAEEQLTASARLEPALLRRAFGGDL